MLTIQLMNGTIIRFGDALNKSYEIVVDNDTYLEIVERITLTGDEVADDYLGGNQVNHYRFPKANIAFTMVTGIEKPE